MKLIQKLSKLALIASVAVLGTACGSDDAVDSAAAATAFRQSVAGTWVSNCRDDSAKGNTQQGSIKTYVITLDTVASTGVEYLDTTCETLMNPNKTWTDSVVWTIGSVVDTAGTDTAYALDIASTYEDNGATVTDHYFTSIKLVDTDTVHLADSADGGGTTAETRWTTFTAPEVYTKQ